MNQERKCEWCHEPIPENRIKTAKYCCQEHYYLAKKERSSESYKNSTAPAKEIKRNENILKRVYLLPELGREIFSEDLQLLGLNWGCSTGETANSKNQIFKIVGAFAYYLDPLTQKITLEKWNSKK